MKRKKVKIFALLVALAVSVLLFAGCGSQTQEDADKQMDSDTDSWGGYFGTLTRRDSSQYNSAVMQVKGLGNSVVLFEFDIMEGSESENAASTLIVAGTMVTDEKGIGLYEHLNPDGTTAYSLIFNRSEDGKIGRAHV